MCALHDHEPIWEKRVFQLSMQRLDLASGLVCVQHSIYDVKLENCDFCSVHQMLAWFRAIL